MPERSDAPPTRQPSPEPGHLMPELGCNKAPMHQTHKDNKYFEVTKIIIANFYLT